MKWDSRGLWYWVPGGFIVWGLFADQPLRTALLAIALIAMLVITGLLRRRDPSWGRSRSGTHPPSDSADG